MCVCVCVRERERERERMCIATQSPGLFLSLSEEKLEADAGGSVFTREFVRRWAHTVLLWDLGGK